MFKVVAILAFVGVASAQFIAHGYNGLGYAGYPHVVAAPGAYAYHAGDVAALSRNVHTGAVRDHVNLNNAILTRDAGAAVASAVDNANLANSANTQNLINAVGAQRNAVNSAVIQGRAVANGVIAPAVHAYGAYGAYPYGGLGGLVY